MSFRTPAALWLLLGLIPYAALSLAFLGRLGAWLRAGDDPALAGRAGTRHLAGRSAGIVAGGLFWCLGAFAAAGPSAGTRYVSLRTNDAEIALALDVSNSMLSAGPSGTRLSGALDFARALRAVAPEARWSLVAFRGTAALLCPPTRDAEAFDTALSWAGPAVSDAPGSDLGAAIALASKDGVPGVERLLVVVTDGNDTGSDAKIQAVKAARAGSVLVFLGAGSPEPAPVVDASGQPVRGADGKPLSLGLNETGLRELARSCGGAYRRLSDTDTFAAVSAMLRKAAGGIGTWRSRAVPVDASPILCGLALAALASAMILSRPPARRTPVRRTPARRRARMRP